MEPIRIQVGAGAVSAPLPARPAADGKGGFQQILKQQLERSQAVTFSRHAEDRMRARNMSLTQEAHSRLSQAVDRAAGKGARESLVLLDRLAFVVNVPSRTVLTAMSSEQARDGVFTRIDSAVLA